MEDNIKFIEEKRNQPHFSGWYSKIVDQIDTFFLIGDKKFFLKGRTNPKYIKENIDIKIQREELEELKQQLIENEGKYVCFYCCKGMLGSKNKFINPVDFLNWVEKNGYHFEDFTEFRYIESLTLWSFSGNLKEYSCSFEFRFFDGDLAGKIMNLYKKMRGLDE